MATGIPFGRGEGPLHYLFKTAWLLHDPAVPVIGEGKNTLPTIHVSDLAHVLVNVVERRPDRHYILAVRACVAGPRLPFSPLPTRAAHGPLPRTRWTRARRRWRRWRRR